MRIVNLELGIDLSFEAGVQPKDLLRRISSESGAAGSIGLISLRSLLNDSVEEANGYVILKEEGDVATQEIVDEAAPVDPVAEPVVEEVGTEQEAAPVDPVEEVGTEPEAAPQEEPAVSDPVATQEAPADQVVEVGVEPEAAPQEEPADQVVEDAPAEGTAKDAVKKAFGLEVKDSLTPKTSENASVRRPRRDMAQLIAKAKSGVHGGLLAAVEAEGYTIVNVENTERWFGFNVPGSGSLRGAAPRFDVSPLKNGTFSVSLYVNGRATKIKVRLVPDAGKAISPDQVVNCMKSEIFSAKIAEGMQELQKQKETPAA